MYVTTVTRPVDTMDITQTLSVVYRRKKILFQIYNLYKIYVTLNKNTFDPKSNFDIFVEVRHSTFTGFGWFSFHY